MPSSPLPPVSRYLWAQGETEMSLPAGTLLASRYRVIDFPLIQDTAPEEPPIPLSEVPPLAAPYLALSSFSVVIPRPFTQVMSTDGQTPLLLLEEVPLQLGTSSQPTLLPALSAVWERGSALHQLAWLWRLAKLWQTCVDHRLAHNLLNLQNIRIDGEDIRLVTLTSRNGSPPLADLGKRWQPWAQTAAPVIRDYLTKLTALLVAGKGTPAGLVHSLVQAIEALSVDLGVSVHSATYSDQGPTRQRNEDACYPSSGFVGKAVTQVATADHAPAQLVIVCDGVGGHEGGDVASQMAIAEVTRQLNPLLTTSNVSHAEVVVALKQAILTANQSISVQNDAAQRQDRNRMGTTIVIALVYGVRLYIAHLGDSRAYRVRSQTCRQLTLDDDVAAREMRLGLELYQDALQNPGSGALVQALGMADSAHLRPTVKLYPVATDSLIVLCSDGLTDHGLLERLWQSELQPVLMGDRDVATATQRLIELANTHNGHDNVTVGLLHLQPKTTSSPSPLSTTLADLLLQAAPKTAIANPVAVPRTATTRNLTPAQTATQRWRPLPVLLSTVLILGLAGIVGVIGWRWLGRQLVTTSPAPSEPGETLSPSAVPPSTSLPGISGNLTVGDYLQIRQLSDPSAAATLLDTDRPPVPPPAAAIDVPERLLSIGSVVRVVSRQETTDNQLWVRLEVCSVPPSSTSTEETAIPAPPTSVANSETSTENPGSVIPIAQPGNQGWLRETDLPIFAERLLDTSITQQGLCTN